MFIFSVLEELLGWKFSKLSLRKRSTGFCQKKVKEIKKAASFINLEIIFKKGYNNYNFFYFLSIDATKKINIV